MFFTQNPIGSSATEDLQDNAISLDYAMNSPAALWQDRFGKQHKTVQQALKDVGFKPAGFDFVSGGTLGIGDRDKCVFYPTDGYWYSWNGKLPYIVPANSGPIPGGAKGWKPISKVGEEVVNVLFFGADPTGIKNSRIAINNAIKFLYDLGGGTLYFPPGKYLVGSDEGPTTEDIYIVLRSNVKLLGSSQGGTTIIRGSAKTIMTTEFSGPTAGVETNVNISFENLCFDGNTEEFFFPSNLLFIDSCTNLNISECTFKNVPGLHALDLNRCKHVRVQNSRFYGTSKALATQFGGESYKPEAIQISWGEHQTAQDYCEDVKVYNCVFDKNKDVPNSDHFMVAFGNHSSLNSGGAILRDVEFYGNILNGCSWVGVKALQCIGFSVHDNTFNNCANIFGLYTNFHPEFGRVDMEDISFINNLINGYSGYVVFSTQPVYPNVSDVQKINRLTISGNKIKNQTPGTQLSVIDCILVNGFIVDKNIVTGECWRFLNHEFCSNSIVSENIVDATVVNAINVIEQRNPSLVGKDLSNNILLKDNQIHSSKHRGIHINCAAKNVVIDGNMIKNPNLEANGQREAIKVDSYPTNVKITNNITCFDNGIPYTYGILASTVNDCYVSGNKTQPGSLGATGTATSGLASTVFLDNERVTENPNGVHSATVGSSVVNINGTTGAVRYLKETGTGSSGWVAK